jgi:hypothetical protein
MEERQYVESAFSEAHGQLPDGSLLYAVSIAAPQEVNEVMRKWGNEEMGK